jgi:hypothetical protein
MSALAAAGAAGSATQRFFVNVILFALRNHRSPAPDSN